ncbi:MAG: hypothetical protein ACSLE8_18220 [Rhodococcus sp. (in: high G+C Gram-positive bacteria)]
MAQSKNMGSVIAPLPAGAGFIYRTSAPGVIVADGPVVAAFAAIGRQSGGHWSSAKNCQHFSASGR